MEVGDTVHQIVERLHEMGGIKFGEFTLKSGKISPVYFDLRVIISYPKTLKRVSELLWEANPESPQNDILCGVPYTALPLATLMSVEHNKPQIIRRKEIKQYGTGKILEGEFKKGQTCLIVEDVITTGSSVLETAKILRDHGLVVNDALVFLDREQGGKRNLELNGIRVHTVTRVSELLDFLRESKKIDKDEYEKVTNFLRNNQVQTIRTNMEKSNGSKVHELTFKERQKLATCPVVRKLLSTMEEKKSNLCVAADVQSSSQLLSVAENIGKYICCLKTHVDILQDWTFDVGLKLRELANKYNFLLFEDRKFADIGNTVSNQYHGGPFKISSWADLVTVHALPGPAIFKGLESIPDIETGNWEENDSKGALIVSQMSSSGNLASDEYTKKCIAMYQDCRQKDMKVPPVGFIAQSRLVSGDPNFIQMTPGVSLVSKGDTLGQNYVSIENAIEEKGADVIIVGRGITSCSDEKGMREMAKKYQTLAWDVYVKKTS